jgi:menaquinone-dependent protoporphyrinogen oxidase
MQKFLQLSPWKPQGPESNRRQDRLPVVGRLDTLLIQMIMMITGGPTDKRAVIDYTDWDDVRAYGKHLLTLA